MTDFVPNQVEDPDPEPGGSGCVPACSVRTAGAEWDGYAGCGDLTFCEAVKEICDGKVTVDIE